jgi:hypothetical protein
MLGKKLTILPVDHIQTDLLKYDKKEQISLNIAITYLRKLNYNIVCMVDSNMNKKENTTADIIATEKGMENEKFIHISVKNKGGAFTFGNLGTGTLSAKKWCNDLTILQNLKSIEKTNLKCRHNISSKYTRFEDISDIDLQNKYRFDVCKDYLDFYYQLFSDNKKILYDFLTYLYSRQSEYEIITDDKNNNVIAFISNKRQNLYYNVKEIYVKNKSIIISPYFEVRFKSEGGKTISSIKMNIQFYKP